MKVYVLYVGKARDARANQMAGEYIKRTNRYLSCEMREIRPGRYDLFARHPNATRALLDPAGSTLDSAGFTGLVARAERGARDLVFVVAGAEGPPAEWRARADLLLSLSPLTFPHELARVVLAEQIYRAATTLRGHPYPK
jgi:23S rRNA (pseudouridine1915-N3)-methyltransferase